jgi:hypothetical protein
MSKVNKYDFANGSSITSIGSRECVRGKRAKINPYKNPDYLDWYLSNKDIIDEVLKPFVNTGNAKMQNNQQLYAGDVIGGEER